MQLPFSSFLALRYLQPKRTFVSIITLISVIGVFLGVTVLVLVISVMTGFDQELRRKVLGFDPHIIVTNDPVVKDWRDLDETIAKAPHVIATAPFVQGPVIVEAYGRRLTPSIRGIDLERELKIADLRKALKYGSLDLDPDEEARSDKALIGIELARSLGVRVGDKIMVYSPGNFSEILDKVKHAKEAGQDEKEIGKLQENLVLPKELTVTGVFESGRFAYDAGFILVPLTIGQEMYGLGDAVHGISVRTTDPYKAAEVQQNLLDIVTPGMQVLTWIDLNSQFFEAIRLERNVMFFLLMFIVLVAGFGIMSNLITVTVQKRREIGIMKALGATTGQVTLIFLLQGIVIGVIGNGLGLAASLALVRWRNETKEFLARVLHVEIFPPSIYQFSSLPAEIVPRDVAIICVSALVICTLAALIPALVAARLDPVKALRYE